MANIAFTSSNEITFTNADDHEDVEAFSLSLEERSKDDFINDLASLIEWLRAHPDMNVEGDID